jgi:predicted nucleic acid-binding protein
MKDNVFLDTNLILYCYSSTEREKRNITVNLFSEKNIFISTQVLQEFINVSFKKFKIEWSKINKAIEEILKISNLYENKNSTIKRACQISEKYKFSFYDSLIISSALESNCKILYSEDLSHNQIIENKLQIINPFKEI